MGEGDGRESCRPGTCFDVKSERTSSRAATVIQIEEDWLLKGCRAPGSSKQVNDRPTDCLTNNFPYLSTFRAGEMLVVWVP